MAGYCSFQKILHFYQYASRINTLKILSFLYYTVCGNCTVYQDAIFISELLGGKIFLPNFTDCPLKILRHVMNFSYLEYKCFILQVCLFSANTAISWSEHCMPGCLCYHNGVLWVRCKYASWTFV